MAISIDLSGRLALVTGAGSGIGLGIAKALAEAGAQVAMNDITSERAERGAELVGGNAFAIAGDVANEDEAERIVGSTADRGYFDILVNNAGVTEPLVGLKRQRLSDWAAVIDVNLRGPYLMSRAFARRLSGRPGVILNIASIAGITGFAGSHAYGVSKAGVVMLTKTLAVELARSGVRVNAVAPGVVDAPMFTHMCPDEAAQARIAQGVPLGRLGRVDEIGAVVAFLCSAAASYVTGATIPVDGGWLADGGSRGAGGPTTQS